MYLLLYLYTSFSSFRNNQWLGWNLLKLTVLDCLHEVQQELNLKYPNFRFYEHNWFRNALRKLYKVTWTWAGICVLGSPSSGNFLALHIPTFAVRRLQLASAIKHPASKTLLQCVATDHGVNYIKTQLNVTRFILQLRHLNSDWYYKSVLVGS